MKLTNEVLGPILKQTFEALARKDWLPNLRDRLTGVAGMDVYIDSPEGSKVETILHVTLHPEGPEIKVWPGAKGSHSGHACGWITPSGFTHDTQACAMTVGHVVSICSQLMNAVGKAEASETKPQNELAEVLAQTFAWLDEKNWLPWYKTTLTRDIPCLILTVDLKNKELEQVSFFLELLQKKREVRVLTYKYRDNDPRTRGFLATLKDNEAIVSSAVSDLLGSDSIITLCQRLMQTPESLEPKQTTSRDLLLSGIKGPQGMVGKRGDSLQIFLYYVSNPDHVWDKEKYKTSNFNGYAFDLEAQLRFTYCLGNAHMEGLIGDWKIEIHYQYLQGFQVRLTPPNSNATVPHFSYPPDSPAAVYTAVKSWVNPAYEE